MGISSKGEYVLDEEGIIDVRLTGHIMVPCPNLSKERKLQIRYIEGLGNIDTCRQRILTQNVQDCH